MTKSEKESDMWKDVRDRLTRRKRERATKIEINREKIKSD